MVGPGEYRVARLLKTVTAFTGSTTEIFALFLSICSHHAFQ